MVYVPGEAYVQLSVSSPSGLSSVKTFYKLSSLISVAIVTGSREQKLSKIVQLIVDFFLYILHTYISTVLLTLQI